LENRFGEQRIVQSEDIVLGRNPLNYCDQREIENWEEYFEDEEEITWPSPDFLVPFWDAGIGKIEKVDGLWRHVVVFGEAEEIPEEGEWFKPWEVFNPNTFEREIAEPHFPAQIIIKGWEIPLEISQEIKKDKGVIGMKRILWKCEYE